MAGTRIVICYLSSLFHKFGRLYLAALRVGTRILSSFQVAALGRARIHPR